MITGGGGNTAAFITAGGVVLVDTKYPDWGQAIVDKVRSVTDKPITTIINTHTHADHNGSNDFFPASVEVVAHENTKTNMMKMKNFQGEKAQFVPDRTFSDRVTLLDGRRSHRLVLLRRRPHQRRHNRRLSGASRRPHGRPLRWARHAWHRHWQWRQRRSVSGDSPKSRRRYQRRGDCHSGTHADDDHVGRVCRVRRVQRGVRLCRATGRQRKARPSTRPWPA